MKLVVTIMLAMIITQFAYYHELDQRNEIVGYKAQVAGQAHYIKCLLDEIRELKEAIREQDNANGNG